ncbi:PAS domain S-box protein [Methylobacillus flagellatus]|uniref:PAS domain S-box protein n=1 Tax=Methylobacillus flagellatus TaxID=405 RepID=UPI002853FCC8|nr:PAS domain S-box protein [Methylobacillus flagellatus]MDR5172124.1 PAS domain S-box protein [Methylobacillus flagellatus]
MAYGRDIQDVFRARNVQDQPAPSFTYSLISNVAGLVIVLGLVLLGAMAWQAIVSTEKEARQEISDTLNSAVSRLQLLIRAAEMTVESAERIVRASGVDGATIQPILESSLAAFEQRPELSYLGIVLPKTGEYGTLERTADSAIQLRIFPGTRHDDAVIRSFSLTEKGFVLHEANPTDGYDPRTRPFYQAALSNPHGGTWIPAYQWITHFSDNGPLWGFSYVKALRDGAGQLISVLDTDFDMPALNRFLGSLSAEYRAQLQIVELGETPSLIGGPEAGRIPLAVPAEFAVLTDFPGNIFVKRMELEGKRRWVAAKRIELQGGLSWLVVASRPAPFIEAALRNQLYQLLGIGLIIAAGLVLALVRMARRFGRPLAELEQRVVRIEQNKLDMPVMGSAATAGEFRETQLLASALDRMTLAIGQQVLAKEQQVASLALKGAIFDFTSAAIFSINRQLKVIEWNTAAERLFGLEHSQVLGRAVSEIVLAPDGPADWVAIMNTKGTGTFRFMGREGAFDAELRLVVFTQDGAEVHTLVINDISERKRVDAALRDSLARFHAAAQATGDVIWDWDLATGNIWWNENFQTLFGYAEQEIEPTIASWTTRIHPEDHDRVVAHIHAVIDGAEDAWKDEYRFRRQDGTYAELFDRGHVLRDGSGRGMRMVGAMQDITERKRAQAKLLAFNAELEKRVAGRTAELVASNQELDSFCHSVSHDLRAPLRGIAGFAEILVQRHGGNLDEKAKNYLGRVLAATHRMEALIDDLLQLSRISREEMRRETVGLSAIADSIVADLRESHPERQVEIAVEAGLCAEGDPNLLRIMLQNLLDNAWKFTSKIPDARIVFAAEQGEAGMAGFFISDNGDGFDMRYANKLFSPFQRLHREAEFPGTGIGLATVKRIVSRHGGRIWVDAEPGKGATFHFSLGQPAS